jgi:predicted MFS family arabinose efflux permease
VTAFALAYAVAAPTLAVVLSFNASAVYVGISLGSVLGSIIVAYGKVTWLGAAGAICATLALVVLVAANKRDAVATPALPTRAPSLTN